MPWLPVISVKHELEIQFKKVSGLSVVHGGVEDEDFDKSGNISEFLVHVWLRRRT